MKAALCLAVVCVVAGCSSSSPERPAGTTRRPDVVIVTIDTLRADRVTPALTPAILGVAARGTRFTAARSVAPLTLPAHASLMTGLYPPRHGVRLNGVHVLGPGVPRLAPVFGEAGYDTAAFVGAYVLDRRFGLGEGFALYDDRIPRHARAMDRLEAERRGEVVVGQAEAWLASRERRRDRPVFLWVHLYDPHVPYVPPAEFVARAGGDAYGGEVAYADAQVGRLITALASAGRSEPVLVIAGDHGESLGDHGESTHGMLLYDSAVRIPLVVAGPDIPQGVRREPVSLVDVAPTVLARAGLRPLGAIDGTDLFGESTTDRGIYAETEYPRLAGWAPLAMLADARWKLVLASAAELYDIERDPGERTDVSGNRPDTVSALRRQVAARRAASTSNASAQPVTPEVAERLRALGYVAASPAPLNTDAKNPAGMMPAWQAFEDALTMLGSRDPTRALPALRTLARDHPESSLFATTYARALSDAGRHRDALAVYRKAAARWPGDSLLLHDLAISAREAGFADEARRSEEAAIVLDPSNALAHNGLGLLHATAGRSVEARRAFERAAALDPTNATYLVHVGNAAREAGDLAAAEAAYRKAVALDDTATDALNGLGVVLVQAGRAGEAIVVLERAVSADQRFVEARLNLGIARQESGDRAGARAAYLEVLRAPARFKTERDAAATLLSSLDAERRRARP